MIKYTTRIDNNFFCVDFDFVPTDIKCSRGNYTATHVGGGTKNRKDIWEGIELKQSWYRINGGNWVRNNEYKLTVKLSNNNDTIEAKATYTLKTMGHHWQSTSGVQPFFYYGGFNEDPNKYCYGYFTDSKPGNPGSGVHTNYAIVPKDWGHVDTIWSDWAYKHGLDSPSYEVSNGRYEKRNSSYEGSDPTNGWISDSGWLQSSRKSCMFIFEKNYNSAKITASGIVTEVKPPIITVNPAKGNSGIVTVKYADTNNPGTIRLTAYCRDKIINVDNYHNEFTCNSSRNYNVDFVKTFASNYQGNDVYYEAWAKNSNGLYSKSSGKKGVQRYNGIPSVPTMLEYSTDNGYIYNRVKLSWQPSTDPENDKIYYVLNIKVVDMYGNVISQNNYEGSSKTEYDFDIANQPDYASFYIRVAASDGIGQSAFGEEVFFRKGGKPDGQLFLEYPRIPNSTLFGDKTRFMFGGYSGRSHVVIKYNNIEYNSQDHPEMFCIEGTKVIFLADTSNVTNITILGWMRNEYSDSKYSSVYNFVKKDLVCNVKEFEIAKAVNIRDIQVQVFNKCKAYDPHPVNNFTTIVPGETYISANIYNECVLALEHLNTLLNSYIKTNDFDTTVKSKTISSNHFNDDALWDDIIFDMKTI